MHPNVFRYRKKPVPKYEQMSLRLETALLSIADEVTELLSQSTGVETKRAAVCRTALLRGLELMRTELKRGKARKRSASDV